MTGEWIKWTVGLTRKAEVLGMAARLGISAREAAAVCMEIWEWAGAQTADGFIPALRPETLDALVQMPGLGRALVEVGWVVEVSPSGLQFTNWERHNSGAAKARAQHARRAASYRWNQQSDARSVTPASRP